jgi:hypothetical protein
VLPLLADVGVRRAIEIAAVFASRLIKCLFSLCGERSFRKDDRNAITIRSQIIDGKGFLSKGMLTRAVIGHAAAHFLASRRGRSAYRRVL